MPPTSSLITATSQQTRFSHNITDTGSKDLDLPTLNVLIGKREILVDAHLQLIYGVHYVLVGRNGAGKSTLLRALGERIVPGIPLNLRILYLAQTLGEGDKMEDSKSRELLPVEYVVRTLRDALERSIDPTAAPRLLRKLKFERRLADLEEAKKTAALRSGARGMKARKELKELETEIEETMAKLSLGDSESISNADIATETNEALALLAELDASLEAMSASTADSRAESILRGLGFTEKLLSQKLSTLSGGWRMRCNLASVLFQQCDILLLDEPTNFLDIAAVIWLESYLQSLSTTLVLVSHDREFVDAIADEVIILRDQKLEKYHGNLTSYYTTRAEQQRRLTRMKEAQNRQEAHIKKTIAGNVKAAKTSGDDKKLKQAASRQKKLNERMGMEVGLRGGRFKLNRDLAGYHLTNRAEIEVPEDEPEVRLQLFKAGAEMPELRPAGVLVGLDRVTYRYPRAPKAVLSGVSLAVHPGERVGIIGLNGAGKSTLVGCLVDEQRGGTRTGSVTRHPKARVAYYSQSAVEELEELGRKEPELTALGLLMRDYEGDGKRVEEHEVRGVLGALGLQGKIVSDMPFTLLSGGQKVRLALGRLLRHGAPHLLVLDEVTTHLDADSVMVLARELNAYDGALVVISHDRFFIRTVIEGEKPEELTSQDGGDDEEGDDWNEQKKGDVFWLKQGELVLLEKGVKKYEEEVLRKKKKKKV
ncbi:hypothetical protein AX16_007194 [Volvariella volvacea WC 439]|nr:hypothetical protein AX16_007194 [Volvariella volvacea WC 439]